MCLLFYILPGRPANQKKNIKISNEIIFMNLQHHEEWPFLYYYIYIKTQCHFYSYEIQLLIDKYKFLTIKRIYLLIDLNWDQQCDQLLPFFLYNWNPFEMTKVYYKQSVNEWSYKCTNCWVTFHSYIFVYHFIVNLRFIEIRNKIMQCNGKCC